MAEPILSKMLQSSFARLSMIGALILLLQIPAFRIHGLIRERENNRHAAIIEVQQTWGGSRTVRGPLILVPMRNSTGWIRTRADDDGSEPQALVIRPVSLGFEANLDTELRRRGFFEVPLYTLRMHVDATFTHPKRTGQRSFEDAIWEEAVLALPIVDRLDSGVPDTVLINGAPSDLEAIDYEDFVTVPLANAGISRWDEGDAAPLRVSYDAQLRGADRLSFSPTLGTTEVELSAPWPDPKFSGAILPSEREVDADGFRARWDVRQPGVSRGETLVAYRSAVREENTGHGTTGPTTLFGVELVSPVDAYRMSRRSLKYEFLFTTLTLMVFFLVEIFAKRRVHPVPYLLIGLALVMFYLLILALSEHVSFKIAYLVSATAVIALVTGYGFAILRHGRSARFVGLVMCGLYGFLYVLLALVDYSLLIGSLGLFTILATVMFLTRNIDWSGIEQPPRAAVEEPNY